MLGPDNRALLIEQLTPPPGFRLDAAVATTFTLDLSATLLPTLAFTGFQIAGGIGDPIATLEALRSTAGKIDVFCQAGAIAVPDKSPDLLAFLEPMVHPVAAPTGGLFHPKIWFVRYVDEEAKPTYRLLVLSRNLTLDNSWDLVVTLDSERVTGRNRAESAALGSLIESLPDRTLLQLPDERHARVLELAAEARKVAWELPPNVGEVFLHHLDRGRRRTCSFAGSRHLVVSPFLDRRGLETVCASGELTVLSRTEELDKLEPETVERLDARVLDGLAALDQTSGSRLGGQLHAKMYVVEQTRNWSKSHVFIGSPNATGAAFSVNTEFLVELRGHKRALGIDQFLGADGEFANVTDEWPNTGGSEAEVDPIEEARRELDNALRRVASIPHTVEVRRGDPSARHTAAHSVRISARSLYNVDPDWDVSVELLTLPMYSVQVATDRPVDLYLDEVATADLTPFVAIRIQTPADLRAACVVIADLQGAPTDRLDVILARQIDTPEKFLRFLYFLLSLGSRSALARLPLQKAGSEGDGSVFGSSTAGVLEMVLSAIAKSPSALVDLDSLVTRLQSTEQGRRSLPDGFTEFWVVVREAIALEGGSRAL